MTPAERRRRGEKAIQSPAWSHPSVSLFRGARTPAFPSLSAPLRLRARPLLHLSGLATLTDEVLKLPGTTRRHTTRSGLRPWSVQIGKIVDVDAMRQLTRIDGPHLLEVSGVDIIDPAMKHWTAFCLPSPLDEG